MTGPRNFIARMPSLDDFFARAIQARRIGDDLRLHPDDIRLLQRILDARTFPAQPQGTPSAFGGRAVVADGMAARVKPPIREMLE